MIPLDAPELRRIARCMGRRDPQATVTMLAGLLTVPTLQANTIRLETLIHLASAHCKGRSRPNRNVIDKWLNKRFGSTRIPALEDPVEDVFIANVGTPKGNFLLFQSQWESSDYFVQTVIDILNGSAVPHECQRLLVPVFALLALSDCIAKRLRLQRWHSEPSIPQGAVKLPSASEINRRARAVTFTTCDLTALGVDRRVLEYFVLRNQDKHSLESETIGHSSLERRPIVELDGDLVLALPHAVSPAIRRFILSELSRLNYLEQFSRALTIHQIRQVDSRGLLELKEESESLSLPMPAKNIPPVHSTLFKYDTGKYVNVVLLHDRMDRLHADGLTSFMEYPERQRVALEKYLTRVARHCESLPDFTGGMTLLLFCGLGAGYSFGLTSDPRDWIFSGIGISDFLMLATGVDRPVTRYLKFLKQKDWVERRGVHPFNVNGDYGLYCHWKENDFRLVPPYVPLSDGRQLLVIPTESVLTDRRKTRKLTDRHVLQTTDGSYVPVRRLAVGAPYKSLEDHPIYGSLAHLGEGRLGGAVETSCGPSWLLVKPRPGGENVQRILYRMWSEFLCLFWKLMLEIETEYPEAIDGPIAVELGFDDVIMPGGIDDLEIIRDPIGEPTIEVNLKKKTAEVRFPSDLFSYFRQPENTGERLILRSIAEATMRIYRTGDIDESYLDVLVSRVVDHHGIRIFHVFRMHDAVDLLLAQQVPDPRLCTYDDFNFFRLDLSATCTPDRPPAKIQSKNDSNKFLHCVAAKACDRLRDRLRQFDCISVIRKAIEIHEAAIQDRVHWRRTARAIIGLYGQSDNVHAIAQERETDRINISLAARTISEIAICECPASGGRQLSQWDLDDLITEVLIFIQVATDSDAIHYDLTTPILELHANGEYTIDRSFSETVITPFKEAYHSKEFEEAAHKYGDLYQYDPPADRKRVDEVLSSEFVDAFRTEFGLTPDDVMTGLGQLMAWAVERDSIVVDTTCGQTRDILTKEDGLTPAACEAFVRTFSIWRRRDWHNPPPGFKRKDLYPWRFSRRLSATFRPIVSFGTQDDDRVIFGVGTLRRGIMHLMAKTECGHLPQEFFESREMKQYIGETNNERGHGFARSIAEKMRGRGWKTRNEVQMTELGAPEKLGDVDVLAWKSVILHLTQLCRGVTIHVWNP